MNIILWILIGSVTGWLVSKASHKRTRESRAAYALLGALGAVGAALIWGQLVEPVITWFDIWLVVLAFIGAAVSTGIGYAVLHTSTSSSRDKSATSH